MLVKATLQLKIRGIILLLLCLYAGMVYLTIGSDYQLTMSSAERQAITLGSALEEHASRTMGEAESILDTAVTHIVDHGWSFTLAERQFHEYLSSLRRRSPQIRDAVIVSPDGTLFAASGRFPIGPVPVGDREYFRHHANSTDSGTYISAPVTSRLDGAWLLVLSRRISNPDGSLKMIVCLALDLDYFNRFYKTLDIGGENSRVLIVRDDGTILMNFPFTDKVMLRHMKDSPLITTYLPRSSQGIFESDRDIFTHSPCVVAYKKSRFHPLVSVISMSRNAILEPWRGRAFRHGSGAAASMLLVVAMAWILLANLKRVERTNSDLTAKQAALLSSEQRYERLVNSLDGIVWEHDPAKDLFTFISSQVEQITGHKRYHLLGEPGFWLDHIHPDDRERVFDFYRAGMERNEDHQSEYRFLTADGEIIWISDIISLIKDLDGRTIRTGIMLDVTERIRARQEMELAAHVFEQSKQSIVITDREGTILRVNGYFTELSGYTAEEAVGKTPRILKSQRQDDAFYAELWKGLLAKGEWSGEIWNRKKNGDGFAAMLSITSVRNKEGTILYYIGIVQDITQQKLSSERIYHLAHYDILTDLANRQNFNDRLNLALRQAERSGRQIAILFLDLDDFKKVNDILGHHAGDLLLQEAAQRLLGCVRKTDSVARLGGDEFAIMLEDIHQPDHVERVAQKIILAVSAPVELEGTTVCVGVSIGISIYPGDGEDVVSLCKNADTAMYRAKAMGKNRCQFFDAAMAIEVANRLAMETDLRDAIGREFFLLYQPQAEVRGNGIIGVEALVRWRHPRHGIINPADFIHIAEETGMINRLGEWVLATA